MSEKIQLKKAKSAYKALKLNRVLFDNLNFQLKEQFAKAMAKNGLPAYGGLTYNGYKFK